MRTVLILLLFCIPNAFWAQKSKTDSLQKIIEDKTTSDTARINTLLLLSEDQIYKDLDNSSKLALEAMDMAKTIDWDEGLAKSYRQAGFVEYYKPNYDKALEYLHKALYHCRGSTNKLLQASIYNNIANIYADLKDFEKALDNYNQFLKVAQEAGAKKDELLALFNIATVYTELGSYNNSLDNFYLCLDLARETGALQHLPAIYNNIARTYQYLEQDKDALKYLDLGIDEAEKNDNIYILATLLRNKGELLRDQHEYELAEKALKRSVEISQNNGSVEWEALAWETLSTVYEKQNNAGMALKAFRKHIELRDSIINEEKKAELIKKDLMFENEKNQALSQAEIARQKTIKNASLMGGGTLLVLAGMGMFLYKRRRDAIHQKDRAEFQTKVAETELRALRAQMNPHFIFNSLNSINSFVMQNDRESASEYLKKFAKLMRMTLENSDKKEILLKEDLDLLSTYFEIEEKRLPNKFDYIFDIDPDIDMDNTLVPPLILQPFIENSIWHGMAEKEGKGKIVIEVRKKGDSILYVVDDDGVGRKDKSGSGLHKSMGMQITSNRIEIINATHRTNGQVKVIDKEQGLRVEVQLPLTLIF